MRENLKKTQKQNNIITLRNNNSKRKGHMEIK